MALSSLQRADVVCVAPHTFFRVVAVDRREDAPADPKILFQPLEGGGARPMTLAEFNAEYPKATIDSRSDTVH